LIKKKKLADTNKNWRQEELTFIASMISDQVNRQNEEQEKLIERLTKEN
jgi:hypothetical protein